MRALLIRIGAAVELLIADVKDIINTINVEPSSGRHVYGSPGTYWAGQRQHVKEMIA
jgi:hypothetical protein